MAAGARRRPPRVRAAGAALRPAGVRLRRRLHRRPAAARRRSADEPRADPAAARATRPAALLRELDAAVAAGRPGRLPARSADRAGVHRPQDERGAGRVRRRGGSLLPGRRRPRRPGRLRRGARRAGRAAARRRHARRAVRGAPAARGVPARAAGDRGARAVQRAARPGARPVRPARGRDRALRGGHRPAVVGVQLLRGRLPLAGGDQRRPAAPAEPAAAPGGARVLPRPPHRALPQGARPGRARQHRSSTPSSWSTPPSA